MELGRQIQVVLTSYLYVAYIPRSLALKIKAQRLFPSDKLMGVFSGSKQVSALRGVCGSDGVKRVGYWYGVPFVKICEVYGGNACMTCQV